KQEMLSVGGDVAVAKGALTGVTKKTDCLLMGNLSQFNRLFEKLKKQPFGLGRLAQDLSCAIANYQRDRFTLNLGRFKLNIGRRTQIMGIINLTPDSFSGDGLYGQDAEEIISTTEQMVNDGADIIDLGGESSRPGARPVSEEEELIRVIPIVKILSKKIKVPISIDTSKPQVARQALDSGAAIVNDISGLRNPKMARLVARYKAAVVIMHMQGTPKTMQKEPRYTDVAEEVIEYLDSRIKQAQGLGVDKEKIIVDPGIGFGKRYEDNLELLKRLSEFKVLGLPILVGPSRKSFIGKVLNVEPNERLFGTIASCVLAVNNGAGIVRVHDVKEVRQALRVNDAILNA
ncbi:MAG TPA: dihydropteroate synthase, partial [Candidatus Omnitrophota bacterium]|nr:dihydropteroate synthase [Candidatus Omnitrophota bacterium]